MPYIIQVSINDNACAEFQVVNTIILNKTNSEFGAFCPTDNPEEYFVFDTYDEASAWFEQWYPLRLKNSFKLPLQLPVPKRKQFTILEVESIYNINNSYTVLTTTKPLERY